MNKDVSGMMLGTAVAQKAAGPKAQDKRALGENELKPLLLFIDADEDGKISKQGWMKFTAGLPVTRRATRKIWPLFTTFSWIPR